MKRIMLALTVLFGGLPKVTFGLEKAKAIYRAARGRYDADESKAVPFAVLATAQAMGAEITINTEAKAARESLVEDVNGTQDRIIQLQGKMRDAENRVGLLQGDIGEVDAVVKFFNTK